MGKVKVLFLGHSQLDTIRLIADPLKAKHPDWELCVFEPSDISGEIKQIDPFDAVVSAPDSNWGRPGFMESLQILGLFRAIKVLLKEGFAFLSETAQKQKRRKAYIDLFQNFDLFSFQYLSQGFVHPLRWIPENKKIMASWWGSDAYGKSSQAEITELRTLMERASVITCHHKEMAEAIYEKLGAGFEDKLRFILFGMKQSRAEAIDSLDVQSARSEIEETYKLKKDTCLLQIGYNAHPDNNHLKVIEALKSLDRSELDKITLFLPLTYAKPEDWEAYLGKLKQAVEELNVPTVWFLEFVEMELLTKMELATDIFINVRNTDATNGAMLEHLYVGSHVVSGAWLKYQVLYDSGIYMPKVADFHEIPERVRGYIANKEDHLSKQAGNPQVMKQHFLSSVWSDKWIKAFEDCLES